MRKITETGNIPISSIGTILWNYLRFFKVYFVFYIIPSIATFSAIYFTSKEKIMLMFQNAMQLVMVAKMTPDNQMLVNAANDAFTQSAINLFSSPSYVIIWILSLVLWVIAGSCFFVGLKHSFYKEVSISAIFKEGFRKTLWFLWTMFSMFLLSMIFAFVIGILAGIFASVLILAIMSLGKNAIPLMYVMYFLFFCICFSPFVFYIPIHFFSENNPFSSLWYSFKTFWSNFFSLIGMGIVCSIIGLVSTLIVIILIGIPIYMYVKGQNPGLPRELLMYKLSYVWMAIFYLFIPYTVLLYFVPTLQTFVAYPQLLEEEDDNDNIEGPITPDIEQQNEKTAPSFIANNASGLTPQVMPNHQNRRPFLNEKIGETMFEKLTSRNIEKPEPQQNPDTPQTPDASNKTEPKGE